MRRLGIVLLLGLLAAPPGASALSLKGFKSQLVTFLLEKVSVPGQFEVRADTVERAEAGATVLGGVHIADAQGDWFHADRFTLEWSPARLLRGEVQIDRLALTGGRLERLPAVPPEAGSPAAEPASPPEERRGVAWPRSPLTVVVQALEVRDLQVSDRVLPGGIAVDGSGAFRDEGDVQSISLAVERTDAVRGAIAIEMARNFQTESIALAVTADEAANGLVARLAGLAPDIPVGLRISGDGTSAGWQGEMALEAGDHLSAAGHLVARWAARIGVELDGSLRPGPRMPPALREAIGSEAAVAVVVAEDADRRVTVERAHIESASVDARAEGWVERDTGRMALALEAAVAPSGAERLSVLTAPGRFEAVRFEATLTGTPDALSVVSRGVLRGPRVADLGAESVNLDLRVVPQADGYGLVADLDVRGPHGPDPSYARVLGERMALAVRGALTERVLELASASVRTAAFSSDVSGTVRLGETVEPALRYTAEVPDLAPLVALAGLDATGRVQAEGTLGGRADALALAGRVVAQDAVVNREALGTVVITHDARFGEVLSAALDLRLDSPAFGAGSARARVRRTAERFDLEAVEVGLLGVRARGGVGWPLAGASAPRGAFDLEIESLTPIGRLAGTALAGHGHGELRLEPATRGTAALSLALLDLEAGDLRLASARVTGAATGLTGTPRGSLEVRAEGGVAGDTEVESLVLHAEGPLDGLALRGDVQGVWDRRALEVRAEARADLAAPVRTVAVESLQAALAGEEVALRSPAVVSVGEDELRLDGLDLALPDDGRVAGAFAWTPHALAGEIVLEGVPLRLAAVLGEVPVTAGTFGATVRGSTDRSAPRLDAELAVEGLRSEVFPPGAAAIDVAGSATWDGDRLDARSELTGDFGAPLRAQARVTLRATETWRPVLDRSGSLDAHIGWRGEIERLFSLLPLPDHLLTGATVLDVTVGGTLDAPAISGELAMTDGRYENLVAGTIVHRLGLTTDLSGTETVTFRLDGTDGAAGRLVVRGRLDGLGGTEPRLEARSELSDFLVVRTDAATAQASGDVSAGGALSDLAVAGTVRVQRAEIRLLGAMPPTVVDLGEVRVLGAPLPETDGSVPGGTDVALDLTVDFPERVFVRGRGLDSEWGGQVLVRGTAAEPVVTGRIRARRGQLDLAGRVFVLDRGEVVFAGGTDIDPEIDVRLVREANGIVGRILIDGTTSAPALSFSSTPPVPQDEVLPRVLFGRTTANLSATEALQLAASIAALTTGRAGVIDNLRETIGVDVLRIESGNEDEGSSANIGRYVREGIYVGAKQSLDGQSGGIVVEIEVIQDVRIDADVGYTGESGVGITWRRDF